MVLQKGERLLASWKCLLSWEAKAERTKTVILKIAMSPIAGYGPSDTLAGHVVLTSENLAFVEDSMFPGAFPKAHIWGGAIPLEQITDVSSNGELIVTAKNLGWKWCLRKLELEGFPNVGADMTSIASYVREAAESRKLELNLRKKERKRRINDYNQSRKKK